jgi:hypothetical protein
MICVYPADCTDFSTNGNGTLAPLSAEVTETLNGEYELTLVHPIDEAGKWQRLVEGCILRAPVPAAMTPRVNFTAPGDDNRAEVWRVNTDFSGAETRKGTLRLRSGPGTKYKVLATYKNGSFVQVIAKAKSCACPVRAYPAYNPQKNLQKISRTPLHSFPKCCRMQMKVKESQTLTCRPTQRS